MIKVKSEAPDQYTFVCDTYEEKNFVDLHQNELFDKFINIQTRGKIKNREDLHEKATNLEFGTASIKYFWNISKELEWPRCIMHLEHFINEEYKEKFLEEIKNGIDATPASRTAKI